MIPKDVLCVHFSILLFSPNMLGWYRRIENKSRKHFCLVYGLPYHSLSFKSEIYYTTLLAI